MHAWTIILYMYAIWTIACYGYGLHTYIIHDMRRSSSALEYTVYCNTSMYVMCRSMLLE